jgi:hypothetical protein
MPIREIPIVEEVVSAIQLSPHPPRAETRGARLPLRPASDETGQVTQDALWLHYPTDTKISFQRLLEDIAKQLSDSGHPKPDEFSPFVLAFACLMPAHQGGAVARLNSVLASVCDSDVTLYFIIPPAFPDFYQFAIPPFGLGRLRSDKLKYRSDKAGSDYYERYRNELREAWAVALLQSLRARAELTRAWVWGGAVRSLCAASISFCLFLCGCADPHFVHDPHLGYFTPQQLPAVLKSFRCELATYMATNNQRHILNKYYAAASPGGSVEANRLFPYFEVDPSRYGGISLELKIQDTLGTQTGTTFDWKRTAPDNIHSRVWHIGPTLGTQNSYDVLTAFLVPQDIYGLDESDRALKVGDTDELITADKIGDKATNDRPPYLCYKSIPPRDPPLVSPLVYNGIYAFQDLDALAYGSGGEPQFQRILVNNTVPLAAWLLEVGTNVSSTSFVQSHTQLYENLVPGQISYTFTIQTTAALDLKNTMTTTLWTAVGGEVSAGWQHTGTMTLVLNGDDSTVTAGVKGGNTARTSTADIIPIPLGAPPKTTKVVLKYCPLPEIGKRPKPGTTDFCFWPPKIPKPKVVKRAVSRKKNDKFIIEVPGLGPKIVPAPAGPKTYSNPYEGKPRGVLTYPIPLSPLGQ